MRSCVVEIPLDASFMRIRDERDIELFLGDEDQASRILNIIPPGVGGKTHLIYLRGEIIREKDNILVVYTKEARDLESAVEIEVSGSTVRRVSVVWP